MTFEAYETSAAAARPVELYRISVDALVWGYTTSASPVNYGGLVYEPQPIKRTELKNPADLEQNAVTLTLPHDLTPALVFKRATPSAPVALEIFQQHIGDVDVETVRIWTGRIMNFSWAPPWAELEAESALTAVRRTVGTQVLGKRCPVPLYSVECGVNRATYKQTGVVSDVTGLNVTASAWAAAASGWFAGGYLEWTDPATGIAVRRSIESSASGVLRLSSAPIGLESGMSADAYPGCNHVWNGDCASKFNNQINCRATPFVRRLNPWNGGAAF